jgi:hypothetical protein
VGLGQRAILLVFDAEQRVPKESSAATHQSFGRRGPSAAVAALRSDVIVCSAINNEAFSKRSGWIEGRPTAL